MKYVIVEIMCMEVPIIFPDNVLHDTFKDMKPISAGKVIISYGYDEKECVMGQLYSTYGKSTSLKLESRPEDAQLIKHSFEFEGG